MRNQQLQYTEELTKLVSLSKTIILKDQVKADIYESEVIKDTISYNYTPLMEDWQQIPVYINIASDVNIIKPEKYWVRVKFDKQTTISIDISTQVIWLKVFDNLWHEHNGDRVITGIPDTWNSINLAADTIYYVDTFKSNVFITQNMWYELKSERFSVTRPIDVTNNSTEDKQYLSGLSSIITTPQEYITVMYEYLGADISVERRATLLQAINKFKAVEKWEDIREPYYLRNSVGGLQLDENNIPKVNPKRFKNVPFCGEKNRYYRELIADFNLDPFNMRTSSEFDVLHFNYIVGESKTLTDDFIGILSENIQVFKHTIYNGVYRSDKEYYNWCKMYLIWMTIMRYESLKMTHTRDIDKLDNDSINNLLYSANLFQFNDIPINYKRRIVKSIERLIARKGTSQVFEDILKLFNLDSEIKISKYYLIKNYPQVFTDIIISDDNAINFSRGYSIEIVIANDTTIFEFDTSFKVTLSNVVLYLRETGYFNEVNVNDNIISYSLKTEFETSKAINSFSIIDNFSNKSSNIIIASDQLDWYKPDLSFLETDISDTTITSNIATTKIDSRKRKNYDNFVSTDATWQVDKAELSQQDFSVLQTKYLSVSTAIDLVQNGMSISFLWNMLKHLELENYGNKILVIDENDSNINITKLTLFEAMTGLLTLTLWKYDIEDIIPHETSGIETIIAGKNSHSEFPNEDSLMPNIRTKLWTIDEVANGKPLTPEMAGRTVDNNIVISEKLSEKILTFNNGTSGNYYKYPNSTNKDEAYIDYENYVEIRNMQTYKMTSKVQYDCFGEFNSYSDWLKSVNFEFYTWLSHHDKFKSYDEAILYLTQIIENKISNNNFNFSMMTGSNSIIINYIERLIRFFKSYTVDLKDINIYFKIGNASLEGLHLLNKITKFDFNQRHTEYTDGIDSQIIFTNYKLMNIVKNLDMIKINDNTLRYISKLVIPNTVSLKDLLLYNQMQLKNSEYTEGLDSQVIYDYHTVIASILKADYDWSLSDIADIDNIITNHTNVPLSDNNGDALASLIQYYENTIGLDSQVIYDSQQVNTTISTVLDNQYITDTFSIR